ncbi:MAG: SusC/RagA family TonB-linked outer membrane protein, partial [Phocaeicola sp.]
YYNPVSLIEENTYNDVSKRIQGNGKASLEIIEGLTYNLNLSYQNEQYTYNRYFSSKSMLARDQDGRAERSSVESKKKMLETYVNFDRTFNNAHKLSLMAGYSWEESNDNDGFQLATYGYFNDALGYYNMGMANNIDRNGLGGWALSTLRMISFYGRANYSYNSKYLLQATVRHDGSSAFGKNNRWATFPSFSAAWRMAEESFIKDMNVFDDLKLRVGYGVSGNSLGFDVFTATQLYGATGWFESSTGKEVHTLGGTRNANPDLKWERTDMFNIGVDFGFFNNRLTGTIEWYNKRTKDLINDVPVSTTQYIYGWLTTNVGEVSNKGLEFSINAIPVQTRDFTWQTGINLSHNKNKVEKLSNSAFTVDYIDKANLDAAGQSNSCQQRIEEGYPIGQFYTWEWAGYTEDGVSQFYVRDPETGERTGETTVAPGATDRAYTGSAQPVLNFGWNNSLTWKKFTLTAFFTGVLGNKVMNATRASLSNTANIGVKNLLASLPETDLTTDYNSHFLSDRYLEDGSYIRLSNLTLGYNFGRISNCISNLRLHATCSNLFTITNYTGIDPEISLGGIEPGIDNRQTYPRTRSFMFGVNINF